MGAGQRTVLSVTIAGIVFLYLFYSFRQSGVLSKSDALFVGVGLVVMGCLSLFFHAILNKKVPDLQEVLTPVFGYTLPKWGQVAAMYFIAGLGVALIVWSQWF